jgi:alpha-mannosidase
VIVNPSPFERTEVVELDGMPALVTVPPLGYTTDLVPTSHVALLEVDVRTLTRIVRGRDVGDSYNYAPPDDDVVVDEPEEESLDIVEDGPLRRVVVLHRTYRWDEQRVDTTTRFETRAGEQFVRIAVTFDNPCDDQRVRIHVPLAHDAQTTRAEGQFAIVERPPTQEPGHGEVGLGAYPASAFVAAGGIALLLEHVTEYELVTSRELALTMLRSVGLISREDNPWREVNAGPAVPIPAAQLHGRQMFTFAWCREPENAVTHAERFRHPLLTTTGTGAENGPREHRGPALSGAALSSLRRCGDVLEARIWNPSSQRVNARFGEATADLRPWEIRTLHLPDQPLSNQLQ